MGCGNVSTIKNDLKISIQEKHRLEMLSSQTNIRDVYNFQGVLGKGGFGTVKLAYILLREFETLRTLDHPNIIKFYEVYQDEMFFYICMEYCAGGELLERITQRKYFKEKEAAFIMEKLFSAVNHMHCKGIVHRDLKPENILFSTKNKDSDLKIVDFGLANKFDDKQQLSTMVGTPLYVSPAVLKGKYDKSCDNWSLGVILYILLVGYPPFYGENKNVIFQKIQSGKYQLESKEWQMYQMKQKIQQKNFQQQILRKQFRFQMPQGILGFYNLQEEYLKNDRWISSRILNSQLRSCRFQILNLLKNFRTTSKFKTEVMKVLTGLIKINDLQIVMEQAGFKHTKEEIERIVKNVSPESQTGGEHSNNNYITIHDLKEIFLRNGRIIPENEIKKMVQEVDPNNDGKISLEEFKQLMIEEEVDYKA
ncbi:protein kinase domain protein [Ichthyophthirius multifiliis]|uniref:Protein kinase domain protein n=1 Tax=Ichthyophthirius multifiliis TaxID=5932 RepID=G0R049_ICHMU|nr:protein kinase domain protein [Ichthyophthirius multifiliis]EGR29148.1 protein kinase domain protein [Ichthyophthirius multifiliis]|eukprot:XP_004030384.1 protein kinase domain protein [Ichthyophthirius multifiliis]